MKVSIARLDSLNQKKKNMKIARLRSLLVSLKKNKEKKIQVKKKPRVAILYLRVKEARRKKYMEKMNIKWRKIQVDVPSYTKFKTSLEKILFEEYVTKGVEPSVISFNISKDVDSQSYSNILEDVIAINSKLGRRDKIKKPRFGHFPRPIVSCCNLKEMKRVYNAIGASWRAIMEVSRDYSSAKQDKILGEMYGFQPCVGIRDHLCDPYWM